MATKISMAANKKHVLLAHVLLVTWGNASSNCWGVNFGPRLWAYSMWVVLGPRVEDSGCLECVLLLVVFWSFQMGEWGSVILLQLASHAGHFCHHSIGQSKLHGQAPCLWSGNIFLLWRKVESEYLLNNVLITSPSWNRCFGDLMRSWWVAFSMEPCT